MLSTFHRASTTCRRNILRPGASFACSDAPANLTLSRLHILSIPFPCAQTRSNHPSRSLWSHAAPRPKREHDPPRNLDKDEARPAYPHDVKHTSVAVDVNNGQVVLDIFNPILPRLRTRQEQEAQDLPVVIYLPPRPPPLGPRSTKSSWKLDSQRYEELRFEDADVAIPLAEDVSYISPGSEKGRLLDAEAHRLATLSESEESNYDSTSTTSSQESVARLTIPKNLALAAGAVVVQINYRALTYPQPIHDVLAGWDWICANLSKLQEGRRGEKEGLAESEAKSRSISEANALPMGVGVYGELVGGSLAIMLGLTECDPGTTDSASANRFARAQAYSWSSPQARDQLEIKGKPYIKAVVTHNAIVDWVFDPRDDATTISNSTSTNPTISNLHDLRESMFRAQTHPSTYFDPFASPIHFLRKPSAAQPPAVHVKETSTEKVITQKREEDEFDVLAQLEEETAHALQPTFVSSSLQTPPRSLAEASIETTAERKMLNEQITTVPATSSGHATTVDIDTPQRRKVPLRWPPSGLPHTVRMPDFLLTTGSISEVSSASEALGRRHSQKVPRTTSSNPLFEQNEEMTKLLRRCWVKYCMLYESDVEGLPGLSDRKEDADVTSDSGHGISVKLNKKGKQSTKSDIRGLVNSGDRLLDRLILKNLMDEEGDDTSSSRRKLENDDEGDEEQDMQAQIKEMQLGIKAKVQFQGVALDGSVQPDAGDDIADEMRVKRIGRWLGYALNR